MDDANKKAKKRNIFKSLSVTLPLLFVSICVILIAVILTVVYIRFEKRMIEEYTRMSVGITDFMEQELDTSKTDEYIEKNYNKFIYVFKSLIFRQKTADNYCTHFRKISRTFGNFGKFSGKSLAV